jgi:hypothetical protein
MDADIRPSTEIDFARLKEKTKREPAPKQEPEPQAATR